MTRRSQFVSLRIVLFYGLAAGAWIILSDLFVAWRSQESIGVVAVNIGKGLLFVMVTGAALFLVLRRVLQTEMQARAAAEATARQLTELRQLTEHSEELFYQHDREHRFTYVSPQAYRLLGYGADDVGAKWTDLLTPSPLNQAALEYTNRALATGEKQPPYRVEVRKKDGTPVLLEVDESPMKDPTGRITGMIGAARDVTQSEKAEKALRESEELYRTVFAAANDAILVVENGRFVDFNDRACEMFGATREELLGSSPAELSPERQPDGRLSSEMQPEIDQRVLSGTPQFFQWLHRRRDGSTFRAEVSLRRFSLSSRKLLLAIVRDVTARLKAEEDLRLSNQVYAVLSQINEAIVRISDPETLFKETCRIAVDHGHFRLAWIGLAQEGSDELQPVAIAGHDDGYVAQVRVSALRTERGCGPAGTAFREGRVVGSADVASDPLMAPWREAALSRGYRSMICLPLRRNGMVIGVLAVYSPEPNSFSPVISESLVRVAANIGFALDVLERNRQRELEQQQLRLQQSALEAAANAIVITDAKGDILWVNEAFTRVSGYSKQDVLGHNPRLLKSGLHDAAFYRQMWSEITAGRSWRGAVVNKRKDGSLYDEEMTITPLRNDSGQITNFIGIKQDVTERKRLEQQFLRAQRMQSIGLLAGGVAHDLNNVLAPVLMALPLLRGSLRTEERDQIIETLLKSVKRGANIVQQVLTYARGVQVQRATVNLRHLTREVARIAEETFPRDIDVRTSLPVTLWPVIGEPTQIHQVLLNLAVNARDAMPQGGELRFSARNVELSEPRQFLDFEVPPGRYVALSVADTGTGIDPETAERMFEPFYTTKPAGKGTGLGLSTVLGIVKSHEGLVEVESKPGAGSMFTVYLPAVNDTTARDHAAQESRSMHRGLGEKVLVVDDEAAVLKVTSETLKAHGYEVITATDGRQALNVLAEQGSSLAVVITDLMMPNRDGLALARSLRAVYQDLPIIAITGLLHPPGEPDRAARLSALGVEHILRKPFSAEELLETLHKVLEASRSA